MAKIKFSAQVYAKTSRQKIKREILTAAESSKEFRGEIRRVFQMANRRIQNIEKAGLISPAVAALGKGDIDSYAKFSMSHDWDTLKIEYGKAIEFLRQPTSTATGVKQYNKHLQRTYNLTPDEFNLMAKSLISTVNSISDKQFIERYLMRYKDFTGELEQTAADISQQIEREGIAMKRAIDRELEQQANAIADTVERLGQTLENILGGFKKFGI